MSKFDNRTIEFYDDILIDIHKNVLVLPGIEQEENRKTFIKQIVESIRRIKYIQTIKNRSLSPRNQDPQDSMFDPLKAAILHMSQGNCDEAFWMVFLFVHFGKHPKAGWRYASEVYGRLGQSPIWSWQYVTENIDEFKFWLHTHQNEIKREGIPRGFGNHRKYQSLDAYSENGTGAAIESYIHWVNPPRKHKEMVESFCVKTSESKEDAFDNMYNSMKAVRSFGRTAKFDYLCLIGNLNFAPIKPKYAYIKGATGPKNGAQLLLRGNSSLKLGSNYIEERLNLIDSHLNVGKQVLEDSLCNWQKSPNRFIPFRG